MTTEQDSYLTFTYFGQSDVGLQRSENQDAFGKYPEETNRLWFKKGQLFIVADGMGGHQRGREASDLAVRTICDYIENSTDPIPLNLKRAFEAANTAIHTRSEESLETGIMGTTCVALLLTEHNPYIAHVGDSRIYRVNEEGIEQLTEDHSKVAEMLREGILTEKEAAEHPSKSVLSRALGVKSSVEVDIRTDIPLQSGNHYVLCSDGLSAVEPKTIQEIVLSNPPREACQRLIDLANEAGGHDNVTVQVIKVYVRKRQDLKSSKTKRTSAATKIGAWSIGLILVVIAGLLFYLSFGRPTQKNAVTSSKDVKEARAGSSTNLSSTELQLQQAQSYFDAGQLDSALTIYQYILSQDPMHMEALRGIRGISDQYRRQGDLSLKTGKAKHALDMYERAAALQPANEELKQLIILAKSQLNKPSGRTGKMQERATSHNAPQKIKESNNTTDASKGAGAGKSESTTGSLPIGPLDAEWQFPNLTRSAITIDQTKLVFSDDSKIKKGLYPKDMEDVDLEVAIKILGKKTGRVGIILGYHQKDQHESFYLFTTKDKSHFSLSRVESTQEKTLLKLQDNTPNDTKDNLLRIKVKVLGPWIMMYHNGKLLNGWLGENIIDGKIGVYAAANIPVEFSQFQISSALDYKIPEQDQHLEEQE